MDQPQAEPTNPAGGDAAAGSSPEPAQLTPVQVPMVRIVQMGTAVWAVALVVVLAVPALHQDDRAWWPWCCVAGALLGLLGWGYLRRGRGNAQL